MTWSPLQIRTLTFLGPRKAPASLEFRQGVNVICGASDTGKSFIVEALDFLLGGSAPLRDIPERVGYDRARIGIETSGQGRFTFERSVEGGDFRCFNGLASDRQQIEEGTTLRAKHAHNRKDTLSGWLLSNLGLFGQRIRRNQRGDTQSLSFRDLAKLIIVEENEIIKQGSPFLTGQYLTRTCEYSALKLLLTGVDDSALVPEEQVVRVRDTATAKIELIDQWLSNLRTETDNLRIGRQELDAHLAGLEKSLEFQRASLQKIEQRLDDLMVLRRDLLKERDEISGRIDEIKDLLARFNLLMQHYAVDLERLSAIEESGSLFIHQKAVPCPLCGAAPGDQHPNETCDGNVDGVIRSAKVEIEKIVRLTVELKQTMVDLQSESKKLADRVLVVEERYRTVDNEIRETISPDLGAARATFSDLVEKRGETRRIVDLFNRMDDFEKQKSELLEEPITTERSDSPRTDLSKAVLNTFSQQIEEILKAWNFPGSNRVYFDESTIDFVIDGKPRGSRGKGLRAITHAAVSIALMEFCRDRGFPHPGFVVLDSPLLAYWAPEGEEDDLKGTDLKDRFYEYLASKHRDSQVIIIENEHPPGGYVERFRDRVHKEPPSGAIWFFPCQHESKSITPLHQLAWEVVFLCA